MRVSVRAKLFLVSVALVAVSLGAADAYLTPDIAARMTETLRDELVVRAKLAAREASRAQPVPQDDGAWDRVARDLATAADARVTIVASDGTVLGDSEVPRATLADRGGFDGRPEIKQALAAGTGSAEEFGEGGKPPTLYAAARFEGGVVRIGAPLVSPTELRDEMRSRLWGGALAVLVFALALSTFLAGRVPDSVLALAAAVRKMADGDFSVRTHLPEDDELSALGRAVDRLAASLARMLGDLSAERDIQARILGDMQEGVVVVDRDGHIVLVNPALRAMLLLGADAVGKLLIETVRHAQLDELLRVARESADPSSVEVELPGLKPRRLLVQASRLSGDDERLLLVLVDVTDVRRLESLRRDFVANASHELRTPIAAVRSATETLRSGALSDSAAAVRFVDIIERNAQRLQSLVEDMLELSKLESNEYKLKRERVELTSVVPIVLALFRERADKKRVRLVAEPTSGPIAVEGDPRALEHILSNLVDNAVKYCASGARVVVRAEADGERVNFTVSDDGPGIPGEHLPRVFERFYRVDAGRSRELGGTGLGLSIVKHMVEAMRGKVSVESEVGRGSAFTVSLPRVR